MSNGAGNVIDDFREKQAGYPVKSTTVTLEVIRHNEEELTIRINGHEYKGTVTQVETTFSNDAEVLKIELETYE